jgi:hypothetical protein
MLVKLMNFEQKLDAVLDSIRKMLLDKNRKYGNSALSPIRVFSKAEPLEQIAVRMDDKLSRIKSAQGDDLEDAKLDLIGYLILEAIAKL